MIAFANDLNRFLTHLAVNDNVAASTQRQALSAILFLYREVLNIDPPWIEDIVRARQHPSCDRPISTR